MDSPFPSNPRELQSAEQVLLGATRLWVSKAENSDQAFEAIRSYYSMFGVEDAAQSHVAILYHSATAASRPIRINALCDPGLTLDESRLVHAVGHAQVGRHDLSSGCLASWLAPAALRLTLPAVKALADGLAARNLIASVRPWSCASGLSDFDRMASPHLQASSLAH